MGRSFLVLCFLLALMISGPAQATKKRTMLHQDLTLRPGESFTVQIRTKERLHVGWNIKQERLCKSECVTAKEKKTDAAWEFSAQHGGSMEYEPVDGKITIEYQNSADHDLILDIFTDSHICDSEACALLAEEGISYPKGLNEAAFGYRRVVLAGLDSMETSEDGSFSRIKGRTVYGADFDVIAIWWLIEEPAWASSCKKWIPEKARYESGAKKAYQFSGSYMEKPVAGILTDVGCSWIKVGEKKKDHL